MEQNIAADNTSSKPILAKVKNIITRSGPGGSITMAKVQLLETSRTLVRAIEGPLREGDIIELLEAERDQKVGRVR
jgi:ribosomal protein S28E/S33